MSVMYLKRNMIMVLVDCCVKKLCGSECIANQSDASSSWLVYHDSAMALYQRSIMLMVTSDV